MLAAVGDFPDKNWKNAAGAGLGCYDEVIIDLTRGSLKHATLAIGIDLEASPAAVSSSPATCICWRCATTG